MLIENMTDASVTHFFPRASYSWNGNTTASPLDCSDENKEALCVLRVLEREMWLKSKSFISVVCVCWCVLVCMWGCETETIRWKAFKGQPTRPWALSHLTDHLIHGSLRHMQECTNICPIHQTVAGLKILKNVFGGWRKHRRGGRNTWTWHRVLFFFKSNRLYPQIAALRSTWYSDSESTLWLYVLILQRNDAHTPSNLTLGSVWVHSGQINRGKIPCLDTLVFM